MLILKMSDRISKKDIDNLIDLMKINFSYPDHNDEDFQKQIQGQLQTMLPSIIDARVKEILDKQGYSK